MTTSSERLTHDDNIADMAKRASVLFTAENRKWRDRTVTEADIALAIRRGIDQMKENPEAELSGTGGLVFLRDKSSDAIDVLVGLGTIYFE